MKKTIMLCILSLLFYSSGCNLAKKDVEISTVESIEENNVDDELYRDEIPIDDDEIKKNADGELDENALTPSSIVNEFLSLLTSGKFNSAQSYLNEEFLFDKDAYMDMGAFSKYITDCSFTIVDEEVINNTAKVTVSFHRPDILDIESDFLNSLDIYDFNNENKLRVAYYADALDNKNYTYYDGKAPIQLIKNNNTWTITNDYFLGYLISSTSINVYENNIYEAEYVSEQKSIEDSYIDNYLELTGGIVDICESYSWKGPGLRNISFKNNGDRTIQWIEVTVFFIDGDANYNAEYTVMGFGDPYSSEKLKPNYSWKMSDNKFYQIENLTDDVDISKYEIKITSIAFEK